MISGPDLHSILVYWLPFITTTGLAVKLFFSIRKGLRSIRVGISSWADTLLNNHMSHIQNSAETAAKAVVDLADQHRNNIAVQQRLIDEMTGVRSDLSNNSMQILKAHHEILTGIEVLKAKVH
jgi:hypothetical protein